MGSVDIGKMKWSFYEVFWRSSSPSTVPVQQRTPGNLRNFPGHGQGLMHIARTVVTIRRHRFIIVVDIGFSYLLGVGTLYAKGLLREQMQRNALKCQEMPKIL